MHRGVGGPTCTRHRRGQDKILLTQRRSPEHLARLRSNDHTLPYEHPDPSNKPGDWIAKAILSAMIRTRYRRNMPTGSEDTRRAQVMLLAVCAIGSSLGRYRVNCLLPTRGRTWK